MSVHRLKALVPSFEKVGENVHLESEVLEVTTDSRKVTKGSLFFAIRGTSVDTHALLHEALQKGALAVVIDRPECFGPETILVPHSRESFAKASAAWFNSPSQNLKLVGVTGTNGKTTCSYLLDQVWNTMGKTTGLIGTVETRIAGKREVSTLTTPGPYELQQIFSKMNSQDVTHAAMEVSSIALDQYRTLGTQFAAALFTNFTQDHLDYHGSMEAYLTAKARLFRDYGIPFSVFNVDDPASESLARFFKGKSLFFGKDSKADFRILELTTSQRGSNAVFETPVGKIVFQTPLLGQHNIYNCLGVLAVNYALGFDLKDVASALERCPGAPGRLERVMEGPRYPSIFVDYAHSDDALRNVLSVLKQLRNGNRLITVFGCGGDRDSLKRPKMAEVVSEFSDVTIATSDNPRTEDPGQILNDIETGIDATRTEYIRQVDRRAAIAQALRLAKPEDLVLIAGKGHETYQIIGKEKVPFDDRAVVREYYA